ncbi:cyclopropane fatty acyl phospholipid synthase [Pseudodesulfovibrio sp.]|uniref:cyclopropane fatty acyl phospholipid synthase n=1 Tax=Pseudodesulfovibrio sp. TaxID=2035812 RepID=UPI002607D545|nr:cyclopropane fatty acyl phospholipid synthase [Pseudodesulfovibrio sp.]MDD3311694.1 cyclopropane fatty acyl phospholipid synthase [Pseudodesulfovibrio sp.]
MAACKRILTHLLAEADVEIGGHHPWDIRITDERLFREILLRKNLALGEGYMRGWWNCDHVDEFICRVLKSGAAGRVSNTWRLAARAIPALVFNLQTPSRSKAVARRHYDLGNDLFQAFLDPYLQYSCAYYKNIAERDLDAAPGEAVRRDLARAQRAKLRLICDKLALKPGERLLDIGCGWGGLARFAAEEYGCRVVGVNISREQIAFAREFCAGLPVEIREQDYRTLDEPFDKIVSVGMFEHVGPKNYAAYMDAAARCLRPGGVFLLHTIGANATSPEIDPWIEKYVFPNGNLPSAAQIARASEPFFVMEDWHNFGPDYDRTLMSWLRNFRESWPGLRDKYGEPFRRMWEYYLQSCAGAFRARDIQLWQVVFTHIGDRQPDCRAG